MRVTTHTPRVLVETYIVPDGYAGEADEALLRMIRADAAGRLVDSQIVTTGRQRVSSRSGTGIAELGGRLAEARAVVDQVLAETREAAVALIDSGAMSERAVAEALGVNRTTVRDWRGVGRT